MEKVGDDEEKKTTEEASDSVEDTRSDKEDDLVDLVDSTEEGFTGPSNSHTVASKDPDYNESDMEDEETVLEFFRRNSGLMSDVTERNSSFTSMNKSEGIILHRQENTPTETEQTDSNEIANIDDVNLNSRIKSPSASDEDTDDSSSNSDLDFSLSMYYFDGSLPVSSHVEESESPVPKDENQMPLLCPKQPELQPTSWRNCCGLLQLLRAADP